ncbi:MAG: 3-hydroxyacyl-[acyl-carrier-protein] dehydratase FabZ [Acidobacteria bacterium]|nr:3-hydroxyacyl-[acyl-carrier-protein] dehydratase FabZ [Acidobacteriota bacterium]MYG76045.1 3-hydroxyacyl-[acyl-carrier-protein] dehydratase FabZ [Acidobacteriota bacterium]
MTSLEGAPPLLDETPAVEDEAPGAITGRRRVPEDEPFFAGHFPAMPVVPGVFMVEALAECARRSLAPGATLASAPLVRFRRRVSPGETLEFRVTPATPQGDRRRFDAVASVEGQAAVQAILEFRVEAGTSER